MTSTLFGAPKTYVRFFVVQIFFKTDGRKYYATASGNCTPHLYMAARFSTMQEISDAVVRWYKESGYWRAEIYKTTPRTVRRVEEIEEDPEEG